MNQMPRSSFSLPSAQSFSRSAELSKLFAMIEELWRTTRQLQARDDQRVHPIGGQPASVKDVTSKLRSLLRDRQRRNELFPDDLFADPAWDILLNLYASHLTQQRETITGIIVLAGVPPTTGLRWVHKLVYEDLLILRNDPLDARRKFVALTPTAIAAMNTYFDLDEGQVCID